MGRATVDVSGDGPLASATLSPSAPRAHAWSTRTVVSTGERGSSAADRTGISSRAELFDVQPMPFTDALRTGLDEDHEAPPGRADATRDPRLRWAGR